MLCYIHSSVSKSLKHFCASSISNKNTHKMTPTQCTSLNVIWCFASGNIRYNMSGNADEKFISIMTIVGLVSLIYIMTNSSYFPTGTYIRAHSRFAPSQWETSLQSNTLSHWLGTNLESALYMCGKSILGGTRKVVPGQDELSKIIDKVKVCFLFTCDMSKHLSIDNNFPPFSHHTSLCINFLTCYMLKCIIHIEIINYLRCVYIDGLMQ